MKKFLTWFSIITILIVSITAGIDMGLNSTTFDPESGLSILELANGHTAGNDQQYSGAAEAIVQQNLEKTNAVNDVTSVVFDFRGYDTMGEAFILLTTVAGTLVILTNHKKSKKEDK